MKLDEKLFQYYLEHKSPEAGQWNTSPECLHSELVTRNYIKKQFPITKGIKVCNIGIGTGDWDDNLGYRLKGNGSLTSIDLDKEICDIFKYRQQSEGHPNPSKVINTSIFDSDLPKGKFDIVTIIRSTIIETKEFKKCLDSCFSLLKHGGHLMFMANLKSSSVEIVEEYIGNKSYLIEKKDLFDTFPKYPFYIYKIKK